MVPSGTNRAGTHLTVMANFKDKKDRRDPRVQEVLDWAAGSDDPALKELVAEMVAADDDVIALKRTRELLIEDTVDKLIAEGFYLPEERERAKAEVVAMVDSRKVIRQ